MTVGELRGILDRSGLSDDAPIFLAVTDVTVRDGNREVGIVQTESDHDTGLTVYLTEGYRGTVCEV